MAMIVTPRLSALRCAFCHQGGDLDWACHCGAVLHSECQMLLEHCTTLGCTPLLSNPFNGQLYRAAHRLGEGQDYYKEHYELSRAMEAKLKFESAFDLAVSKLLTLAEGLS